MTAPAIPYQYATVRRLRAEGFETPAEDADLGLSDAQLRSLARAASKLINGYTRQWFCPVYVEARKISTDRGTMAVDPDFVPVLGIRSMTYAADRHVPVGSSDVLQDRSPYDLIVSQAVDLTQVQVHGAGRRFIQLTGAAIAAATFSIGSFGRGANNLLLEGWIGAVEADGDRDVQIALVSAVAPPRGAVADGYEETLEYDQNASIGQPAPDEWLTVHDPRDGEFARHARIVVLEVDADPVVDVLLYPVTDSFEVASAHAGADLVASQTAVNGGITFSIVGGGSGGGASIAVSGSATEDDPLVIVATVELGATPVSTLVSALLADTDVAEYVTFAAAAGVTTEFVTTALAATDLSAATGHLRVRKEAAGPVTFVVTTAPGPDTDNQVVVDDSGDVTTVTLHVGSGTPWTVEEAVSELTTEAAEVIEVEQLDEADGDEDVSNGTSNVVPYATIVIEPTDANSPRIPAGATAYGFGPVPEAIAAATVRLVMLSRYPATSDDAADVDAASRVVMEQTDNYRYMLSALSQGSGSFPSGGTGDVTADRLLRAWMRPAGARSV